MTRRWCYALMLTKVETTMMAEFPDINDLFNNFEKDFELKELEETFKEIKNKSRMHLTHQMNLLAQRMHKNIEWT